MGHFFNNVFHQGCSFELSDCITEPAYCTTTDKGKKCLFPKRFYLPAKTKQNKSGKLGKSQALFISVTGGDHNNLGVCKFSISFMVKGFGRNVMETIYVVTFIIMMSIRDS